MVFQSARCHRLPAWGRRWWQDGQYCGCVFKWLFLPPKKCAYDCICLCVYGMCTVYVHTCIWNFRSSIIYLWCILYYTYIYTVYRGCCTKAKNLGLERLGLAHRWLWAVLQKRHTRVLRIWWKKLKHRYSSNESFCVFILEELCQTSSSGVSSKVGFSTWESVKGWGHWFLSRNIVSKELSSYPGGTSAHRVFIYTYNFGCGNLQCSRHKPLPQ